MRIIIRTDASSHIGTGHVMRCLTLADELKTHADVTFICQELEGNLIGYIRSRGYSVHVIARYGEGWEEDAKHTIAAVYGRPERTALLIVDHYGLDARFEAVVRPHVRKLIVIDDLANRPHRCDLLLDQNGFEDAEQRYAKLVEPDTVLRLGPQYALLRPEFAAVKASANRSDEVVNVLVSFGGADRTGESMKTLQALKQVKEQWPDKLRVTVLLGKINAHKEQVRLLCEELHDVHWIDHAENMAELMKEADLAIGSGGTTTWERCCMGLPSIVILTADNQVELSEYAAKITLIALLGHAEEVQPEHIQHKIVELIRAPELRAKMSLLGSELVDGLGARRIAKELLTC